MEGFQEFESPEIFCPRADRFSCPPPSGRRALDFSRISDKIGSNGIVKPHQNQTFRFFGSHFVGGAERRPLILWLAAHGAARQAQVRNPLRFFNICFA